MPALVLGGRSVHCDGLIFDKDGTLIDSFVNWPRLIKKRIAILREEMGFDAGFAGVLERFMGLSENGEVVRRSPIVIGTREQTASAVCAGLYYHLGIPWDTGLEKVLAAFAEADRSVSLKEQAVPVSGTVEALRELHAAGFKLAVATNDNLERTGKLMAHAGFAPYISAYACRDEVKEAKPAPDAVLLAASRLGLGPVRCAVIGDALLDIKMAKNAGAGLAVGVLTGASLAADFAGLADIILPSAACLKPAVYC
jgi:phosphoglycolate phosphatase